MRCSTRKGVPLAMLLLLGCTDPASPPVPASLVVASAAPASGLAGEPLPDSVAVRVLDGSDRPVARVTVEFAVVTGAGAVSSTSATTGSDGTARVRWILGEQVGENVLEARVRGTSLSPATFRSSGIAGSLARVVITPDSGRINAIGFTRQLSASTTDRHGNPIESAPPAWTTLDPVVASVTDSGKVTGISNGVARVVATVDAHADTAWLTVRQVAISVRLDSAVGARLIGQSLTLSAVAVDSNAVAVPPALLTWTSADTTVATVDSVGVVTLQGVGPVEISATSGDSRGAVVVRGAVTPMIVAGSLHTCALAANGKLFCWGRNDRGQLGDGTTTDRSTATPAAPEMAFKWVTAGVDQTCGLANGGALYCWGSNSYGEMGNGESGPDKYSSTPVAVAGGLHFSSAASGGYHACGLTTSGKAYCWGGSWSGELGRGTNEFASVPVPVDGGRTFRSIRAGFGQTCATTTAGQLYCWGDLGSALAPGDSTSSIPVPFSPVPGMTVVALGFTHDCGLDSAGAAFCWGANGDGQLGDGAQTDSGTPVAVLGGISFRTIDAINHSCGVDLSGRAYCWGWNFAGQTGSGSGALSISTPVAVSGGLRFRDVVVGAYHTCGMTENSVAYCWGSSDYGELGNGAMLSSAVPVAVSGWPTN